MKAREKNSGAAFVILSGYEQFDYARTALSLGVMRYLLKPVNVDELAALLSRYKEDIFKKIFGERSHLQSPQLTVLWDSLPSALCSAEAHSPII